MPRKPPERTEKPPTKDVKLHVQLPLYASLQAMAAEKEWSVPHVIYRLCELGLKHQLLS